MGIFTIGGEPLNETTKGEVVVALGLDGVAADKDAAEAAAAVAQAAAASVAGLVDDVNAAGAVQVALAAAQVTLAASEASNAAASAATANPLYITRRLVASLIANPVPGVTSTLYGALSRAQEGAGIATAGTSITEGNASGHWQVSGGRLFPSTAGDTANLSDGAYLLVMNNGETFAILIEANTWDVATQAEWDFVSLQAAATLAGKKIALRNSTLLDLKITGATGTAFRRVDLRSGGNPLVIEGRFGAVGYWSAYCEINRVQELRGARGITFRHLRTSQTNVRKFSMVAEAANALDDIIIEDCWVTGQHADPFGDYSTSSNYPNLGVDLISTAGSVITNVGNLTIRDCLIEWGAVNINVSVGMAGKACVIERNEIRFCYEDGIKASGRTCPITIHGNYIHSFVGLATDSLGLHPDAIQLIGLATATVDWEGVSIKRNVILNAGTARGHTQGIFLDDFKTSAGDSGRFFVAEIEDNIVCNNVIQGIWIGQAKNCTVRRNTVISWNQAAANTTGLLVGQGSTNATNGGGSVVTDNIADGLTVAAAGNTESGNIVAGRNGVTIAYPTLFDGPFNPASRSQAIEFLRPRISAGARLTA